jgi:hypothetical protein
LVLIMMIVSTKQFFMKLLRWKTKGWKVSSDVNLCVIKIDYWKGCIHVKKGSSLFDCKWMYLCQASSEWWLYLHACNKALVDSWINFHVRITFVVVTWMILIILYILQLLTHNIISLHFTIGLGQTIFILINQIQWILF